MGKKELPVLLRDKAGMWMNAQGTQQICFSIQAGIFIQVQVNSAHKLKKWLKTEKAAMGWEDNWAVQWTELKLMGSGQVNHEQQRLSRHKELFF